MNPCDRERSYKLSMDAGIGPTHDAFSKLPNTRISLTMFLVTYQLFLIAGIILAKLFDTKLISCVKLS